MTYDIGVHDGRPLMARPLEAEDEDAIVDLAHRSTHEDLRLRFFSMVELEGSALLHRLSHVDPATTVALAAFDPAAVGREILAIVRLSHEPGATEGEFAIVVRSDLKGQGIGHALMELILHLAPERGLTRVFGDVLAENQAMLHLIHELGAKVAPRGPSPGIMRVYFDLGADRPATSGG
jgi:acetyltransferase